MLPALPGLDHAAAADLLDKVEAHLGDGGAAVEAALGLHLQHDVLEHLRLVRVERELLEDARVALGELARGEADGQLRASGVVFDQVDRGVQTAVHRAAVVVLAAEVLPLRLLLIAGDVHRVVHQLVHALVLHRRDRHHRHPQQRLHGVDVDGAAVAGDLVHHVERHDHRHVHLQQLHGEIEVSLDVAGVHDVDDGAGLLPEHEVPAHQLLAGVGGHGIDARQVGDERVGLAADHAVLPVDGHAGEIADVLVGAGELVKERGLAAVLVADQRERERRPLRERVAAALGVELALLAQTGVGGLPAAAGAARRLGRSFNGLHADLLTVREPQRQLVAVHAQLHGVAHRRELHRRDLRAGDHAHIQKMLPQRAFPAHGEDPCALAGSQIFDRHRVTSKAVELLSGIFYHAHPAGSIA